jgi:hypothetical protein
MVRPVLYHRTPQLRGEGRINADAFAVILWSRVVTRDCRRLHGRRRAFMCFSSSRPLGASGTPNMELFAITGILALSLIFALLVASAALKLTLFLMVRYNAATGSAPRAAAFGDSALQNGSLTAAEICYVTL